MGNKITRRRLTIDERYTRPQGLYPHRDIDQRKLRRLILDSKLAPCFPGGEEPASDLEECPICFLHYPSLNRSKCCSKGICTECYLQMKSPHSARPTQCPFCKTPNYTVDYRGAKTLEEKGVEQAEEQKVIEAKIRMRQQELQDDEEREQRREEDIREGRITPRSQLNTGRLIEAVPMDEMEGLNWQSGWGNVELLPQQMEGGVDVAASQQQAMVPLIMNVLPPTSRERSSMGFPAPQGYPTPQTPAGARRPPPGLPQAGFTRQRDEEFDLDLEDIMVMEAIWLSIQEQGARHRFSEAEPIRSVPTRLSGLVTEFDLGPEAEGDLAVLPPPPPPIPGLEARDHHLGLRGSMTGGLAGAIAAMAERHAAGGDAAPASQQTNISAPVPDSEGDNRSDEESRGRPSEILHADEVFGHSRTVSRCQSIDRFSKAEEESQRDGGSGLRVMADTGATGSGREDDTTLSTGASEGLADWVSSTQREFRRPLMYKWSGDQSSEQVEVGTSFSSSIPSASDLPWEAPDIAPDVGNGESSCIADSGGGGKVMLPESFEEQMMLAMALSLADAQLRVRQGDNSSGPLAQHAHNEQSNFS